MGKQFLQNMQFRINRFVSHRILLVGVMLGSSLVPFGRALFCMAAQARVVIAVAIPEHTKSE